jgi:hypothetical protein
LGSLPDGGTPPATITIHGADASGRITSPVIGRFGYRPTGGGLTCVNDTTAGSGVMWYSEQPR